MSLNTREVAAAGAYERQARAASRANESISLFSSYLNRAADGMKAKSAPQDISIDADNFTNGGIAGLVASSDATKDLSGESKNTSATAAAQSTGPVFSKGSNTMNYDMIASSSGDILYNSPLPSREETRYPSAVRIRFKDGEMTVEDLGDARALTWGGGIDEPHYPSRAQIIVTEDGSYNVTYYDDNGQEVTGFDTITSQPKSGEGTKAKTNAATAATKGVYASAATILANGGIPIEDKADEAALTDEQKAAEAAKSAAGAAGGDSANTQVNSSLSALFGSDMSAKDMQTLLMMSLMGGMSGSGSTSSLFSSEESNSALTSTNPAAAALAAATSSLAKAFK